jgi:hypothetical protein
MVFININVIGAGDVRGERLVTDLLFKFHAGNDAAAQSASAAEDN